MDDSWRWVSPDELNLFKAITGFMTLSTDQTTVKHDFNTSKTLTF